MLFAILLVVVVCGSAIALPPSYLQPEIDDKTQTELKERDEIINTLVYALMEQMAEKDAEEKMSYVDNPKEVHKDRDSISKKTICHFKLCEMGKRRR